MTNSMFEIEQINALHTRLAKASTLLAYIKALSDLGIERYDSYLADGHSEYYGKNGQVVSSPPVHGELHISEKSDQAAFLYHLKIHEQGESTYFELSEGLAESGVNKWTVDTTRASMTYYDKFGNEMLTEEIK
ncbi:DUF1398 domain-containing protein [Deinococcus sp. KNUC1210]|uniref:DUF1398 domain-containing protein n=1 Tax=Deinococcus sp. KNUC1210 TaxID=2917691 RepID=UPI001EF04608|nr:DUF1398 family protein [Deinococcus sp. KNUC1210]ULH15820.1 DUF1398 domain-containing protein [Deinococcus sp. KNUC1210]